MNKKERETVVENGVFKQSFADWMKFLDWVSRCNEPDWFFRGEKIERPLIPTVYRNKNFKKSIPEVIEYGSEEWYGDWNLIEIDEYTGNPQNRLDKHLDTFKKGMQGHCGLSYNETTTAEEWWGFARHHGLATPMLDWSSAVGVSLFFAFAEKRDLAKANDEKNKNTTRIVSVLRRKEIEDLVKNHSSDSFEYRKVGKIKLEQFALKFIEPLSHHNKNMIAQQGTLAMIPIIKDTKYLELVDINEWCKVFFVGRESSWVLCVNKIEERENDREKCLKYLNLMNINYKTLFPGPEGAAKHANLCLEIPGYA